MLGGRHQAERRGAYGPSAYPWPPTGYEFLLQRLVDRATLARAHDLAKRYGVHPHQVLIANGWLSAEAYYRELAQACALPFTNELTADETAPPSTRASPRDCLARGPAASCWRPSNCRRMRCAMCSRGCGRIDFHWPRRRRCTAPSWAASARASPRTRSTDLPRASPSRVRAHETRALAARGARRLRCCRRGRARFVAGAGDPGADARACACLRAGDPARVIEAGEHKFIKHRSFIHYRFAEIKDGQSLVDGAKDDLYVPRDSVSDDLYERICDGLLDSEHTPAKVLRYWEGQFA